VKCVDILKLRRISSDAKLKKEAADELDVVAQYQSDDRVEAPELVEGERAPKKARVWLVDDPEEFKAMLDPDAALNEAIPKVDEPTS
jgi:hypothetical protein